MFQNGVDGVAYTAVVTEENPFDSKSFPNGAVNDGSVLRIGLPVGIFETKIEVINGISSAPSTAFYAIHCLDPGGDGRIVDAKFLNDDVLLALCHSKGTPPTPFRASPNSRKRLTFITYKTGRRICFAYYSGR